MFTLAHLNPFHSPSTCSTGSGLRRIAKKRPIRSVCGGGLRLAVLAIKLKYLYSLNLNLIAEEIVLLHSVQNSRRNLLKNTNDAVLFRRGVASLRQRIFSVETVVFFLTACATGSCNETQDCPTGAGGPGSAETFAGGTARGCLYCSLMQPVSCVFS